MIGSTNSTCIGLQDAHFYAFNLLVFLKKDQQNYLFLCKKRLQSYRETPVAETMLSHCKVVVEDFSFKQ